MDKIAVFLDDAEYARRLLDPLMAAGTPATQWVMVACAPRMTHRIGKWVSNASREQWRDRWAAKLRANLEPTLPVGHPGSIEWVVARGPLNPLVAQLRGRVGTDLRVFDARRPKLGVAQQPLTEGQTPPQTEASRWAAPVAVSSSLSVLLALTD